MPKRIVVCCDGTWNTPDETKGRRDLCTNVAHIAELIAVRDAANREQYVFYDKGVGTDSGVVDTWLGGAFGAGLDQKIQQAYLFVVENYEPGDEVFLFGFSRGAYTARSTAGLIRNCGVLRRQY